MIKLFFRLILLAAILLVLGIIFAPNLASTKTGKALFFKLYRVITGTTLTIEKVQMSWWEGQRFEGISYEQNQGQIRFQSAKIFTDATLWQLLFYRNLGKMHIDTPRLVLEGTLPLPPSMAAKLQLQQAGFTPSFSARERVFFFGHVLIKNGSALFLTTGLAPIELQGVEAAISLFKSQVDLKAAGQTSQGDIQGKFDIVFQAIPSSSHIDLQAELQHFPMRSIDQIIALVHPPLEGEVLGAIGEAIDVQLKLRNLPETLELFCDAKSPSFSAHIETQTHDNRVTLASPALIQFQIPSPIFQKFTLIPLENHFSGQLKIDQFSLPIQDKENFSLSATLKGDPLHMPQGIVQPFSLFFATEAFKTRHFTIKVDSPQLQLSSTLYLPDALENLSLDGQALLPANTRIDFSAKTFSSITAHVQGDAWQADFLGGYDPRGHTLFLSQPAHVVYHLKQLPSPCPPLLQKPIPLHVHIQPFRLSLLNFSGILSADLSLDPLTLSTIPLSNLVLSVKGDLKTRKGSFQLSSKIGDGTFTSIGTFMGPEQLAAQTSWAEIPTGFFDLFLLSHQHLTPILGPVLNGSLNLVHTSQKKQLDFQISTETLTTQASLEQNGDSLKLIKPLHFKFLLSPKGYQTLTQWLNTTPTPFALLKPAMIQATISSLRWPLMKDDKGDPLPSKNFSSLSYEVDLSIPTLIFSATTNATPTGINNLQLHVQHDAPNVPYTFKMGAQCTPQGSVALQGKIDLQNAEVQLQGHLDQFPPETLDVISHTFGKTNLSMKTLFGPEINLSLSSTLQQWTGPITFQLSSSNIRASLNGSLTEGVLSLNEPLYAQVALTHELSRMVLNILNPLSLTTLASAGPITIEIPSEGFSYPVYPLNTSQIQIPSARLELGKLYCHNEGNLNIALSLLKLSQYSQDQNLELWLAPLDFHVQNGNLDCERTEILIANTYQICSWGNVDFVKDKVDMILGLTSSCLKKAFGIKNLPENYVLRIPMQGPLNDVKINSTKATAKIGALLLWQQKALAGALGGGPAGAFLGELINKIGPLPDSDATVPPAKKPFPWDSDASVKKKKTSESSHKARSHIRHKEPPLKQALKLLR